MHQYVALASVSNYRNQLANFVTFFGILGANYTSFNIVVPERQSRTAITRLRMRVLLRNDIVIFFANETNDSAIQNDLIFVKTNT